MTNTVIPNRIDVNVWNANTYGNGEFEGVVVSGYQIRMGEQYPYTDTHQTLFSVQTDLSIQDHDDEWYEDGDESMPAEVKAIVDLQIAALSGKVDA